MSGRWYDLPCICKRITPVASSLKGNNLKERAIEWIFVSPENSYVKALTLNVSVLGDGHCEEVMKVKWGKNESKSDRAGALRRERGTSAPCLCTQAPRTGHADTQGKWGQNPTMRVTLFSDLQPPELWANRLLLGHQFMVFCYCNWSCNIFLLFIFAKDGVQEWKTLFPS